ncbi:MAG: Crp/Fnr family transcriptional regulator [Alsobacter sp.]
MSLDPRSDFDRDRVPPKHDASWTLGFSREGSFAEPDAKASRHQEFETRAMVIDEGDEARSIYLIIEGAVMLSKLLPDGRRQIIELLGPGDVFGITSTAVHDVCAETLSPVRVVVYDRRKVDETPALQQLVSERMRAQICHLHDHAVLLGRKSALERVATFLMRLVPGRGGIDCIGPGKSTAAHVRVPLTRQEIADYLGLTLETVSRAFSQLKRDGFLSYGRNDEVTITNVCRLCHVTGAH